MTGSLDLLVFSGEHFFIFSSFHLFFFIVLFYSLFLWFLFCWVSVGGQ